LSPYFITNTDKMEVQLNKPRLLLIDGSLNSLKDIVKILEQCQQNNTPLVIIANEIESEALSTLVVNKIRGNLQVVAVKAPGYGEGILEQLEDIGVVTSGKVASNNNGNKLTELSIDDLGLADKVIVNGNSTTIVSSNKDSDKINQRIESLKSQIEGAHEFKQEHLRKRIAKLDGGVAVIKVGAASETEMKEKKDRIDDALAATKAAVEEGIVIGGGAAIIKASKRINLELQDEQKIGADIVLRAIKAPIRQILENAGYDAGIIISKILESEKNIGFNAANGEYIDMFEAGVIDPFKVERVALQNASSIASLLLTTEASISIIKDKK